MGVHQRTPRIPPSDTGFVARSRSWPDLAWFYVVVSLETSPLVACEVPDLRVGNGGGFMNCNYDLTCRRRRGRAGEWSS